MPSSGSQPTTHDNHENTPIENTNETAIVDPNNNNNQAMENNNSNKKSLMDQFKDAVFGTPKFEYPYKLPEWNSVHKKNSTEEEEEKKKQSANFFKSLLGNWSLEHLL